MVPAHEGRRQGGVLVRPAPLVKRPGHAVRYDRLVPGALLAPARVVAVVLELQLAQDVDVVEEQVVVVLDPTGRAGVVVLVGVVTLARGLVVKVEREEHRVGAAGRVLAHAFSTAAVPTRKTKILTENF